MDQANRYLDKVYRPAFNAEFMEPSREQGTAFVPRLNAPIADILCEHFERVVGRNNCVTFGRLTLQIPADSHRCNYVKTKIRVHRYPDTSLAIFHGPRLLARYQPNGDLITEPTRQAA